MNVTKIISAILAIMAAVLIAMAGKSCAKDAAQKNAARRSRNTTETQSFHLITDPPYNDDDNVPQLITDPPLESVTEREYVTVTNMFGDVVETVPVTTPEEADIPTTTLSMLDAYNAEHSVEEQPTTEFQYGTVKEDIVIEIY